MREKPTETDTAGGSRFNRRTVLKATGAVVGAGALFAGTSAANTTDCRDCIPLEKVDKTPELNDVYEWEVDGRTIAVKVVGVTKDDGDTTCVTFSVIEPATNDDVICRIDAKGGPYTRTRHYCTGATRASMCAPQNPNSGKRYEISHVTFYYCKRDGANNYDCPTETITTTEMERGPGGQGPPGQNR